MSAALDLQTHLGAATEDRIAAAFRDSPLITAKVAARLLKIHEKTLRQMAEAGVIRSVIVGASTRRYTEADVRAYLAGQRFGEIKPCRSTERRTARSGTTTSSTKVIGFTEARAKRLREKRGR